jgi:ribonuclease E
MEQSSHVRKVEKAMKEALKNDRARIQVGRISSFGLMEMSRQRLRTGVLEASTRPCPHCEGTGLMRTPASSGLSALRMIEDEATRGRGEKILLRAGRDAAVYVLNKKRAELADIESRYHVSVEIVIDESFEGAKMAVESSGPRPEPAQQRPAAIVDADEEEEEEEEIEAALVGAEAEAEDEEEAFEAEDQERSGRKRRRRRRGGRGRRRSGEQIHADELPPPVEETDEAASREPEADVEDREPPKRPDQAEDRPKRRRRRGKANAVAWTAERETPEVEPGSSPMAERPTDEEPPITATEGAPEPEPKPKRTRRKKAAVEEAAPPQAPPAETGDEHTEPKPKRRTRKAAPAPAKDEVAAPGAEKVEVPTVDNDSNGGETSGKPRSGWWQRTFG